MLRITLALATLVFLTAPASADVQDALCLPTSCGGGAVQAEVADPNLGAVCRDPCVTVEASAGTGGVTVSYQVNAFDGSGAHLHADDDGVTYDRGSGITRCHTFVGTDLSYENWCVF